jgi:hypothetical protein
MKTNAIGTVDLKELWSAIEDHSGEQYCEICGAPLFDSEKDSWFLAPDGGSFCWAYGLDKPELPCFSYRSKANICSQSPPPTITEGT